MRSLLLTCALSASLAPQVFAQAPVQQQAPQMIPVAQRSHDFGTVARSAKTEHRFVITNVYQQPMHISSVRASCGCTTPIIEKQVINPGETGTILARFNTGTHTGQKQATLTVSITKPFFTELQLTVRGYIRSDIVFLPGEVNFGNLAEGESKSLDVELSYAGRNDWKILGITAPEPFLKPSFQEVSRLNGQVKYKITALITGDAPAGPLNSQLVLQTNDIRLKQVPLAVMGQVQSNLEVNPVQLAMGELKAGELTEQRFVLRGIKPFKVTDVLSEDMEVRFEPTAEAKTVHLLVVKLLPDPMKAKGSSLLTFITDMDDTKVTSNLTYKIVTQSQTVDAAKPLASLP